MSGRRWAALAVGVVVVGAVAVAAQASGGGTADADAADVTSPRSTVTVERRDLVEREELDGTLGHGDQHQLALGGQGTITGLADEGTTVARGGILGEVDGRPVVLLYGERPLWRPLGDGVTDGADVHQLEDNLVAMGYATAAALGPDEQWTSATTAALQRWQDDLGVEDTGRLDVGAVVFSPAPVRVADHIAGVGSPAGAPALTVTGTRRVVSVGLPASERGLLEVGQAVEVVLPDETVVAATVQSIATVVEPGDPETGSEATIPVTVVLDDAAAAAALDEAPVEVQVVSVQAEDALTVPVDALLALGEGGYAVERPDGELVGVRLGASADGWVEVEPTTGELDAGDDVVVPR